MLNVGDKAPEFTLTADDGTQVSLADYRGQKVVIYFYPKADTPGCTKQACAVRDVYENIETQGAAVIGISPDKPPALVKFQREIRPALCPALRSGSQGRRGVWRVGRKEARRQDLDGHHSQPLWRGRRGRRWSSSSCRLSR